MKVTIRIEGINAGHTTLRVFVNGASAGLLTVRTEGEAAELLARLTTPLELREELAKMARDLRIFGTGAVRVTHVPIEELEVPAEEVCAHAWAHPSEDHDRVYCQKCGEDGDA